MAMAANYVRIKREQKEEKQEIEMTPATKETDFTPVNVDADTGSVRLPYEPNESSKMI